MAKFDINPYETLGVETTASVEEVRKAYRKLCLKYHPDKQHASSEETKDSNKVIFEQVQFAHSILSDEKRRKKFDKTGSLDESNDDFDWYDYFQATKAEISEESIKKDKLIYQGSEDEEIDIIESWNNSNGDFLELFESIPHTEVNKEDEIRLFDKVKELIKEGQIEESKEFNKYEKKRDQLFNKLMKKMLKESKQAEKIKKDLKLNSENDLRLLIQNKRKNDMNNLITKLEEKYLPKKKKKKSI